MRWRSVIWKGTSLAVLSSEHLLDQAAKLVVPPPAGPPRQVDVRRAISAAYYAVFHHILTAGADSFVGVTKRGAPHYTLLYRSVDHRSLRELCTEARKQKPSSRYQQYAPADGFGADIKVFSTALIDLQEQRHAADYEPSILVRTSDAKLAIDKARTAIQRFRHAGIDEQKSFLTLLLFPPR